MENSGPNYMNIASLVLAGGSYVYTYQATNAMKNDLAKISTSIDKTNESIKVHGENVEEEFKKINQWIESFDARLNFIEDILREQLGINIPTDQ